MPYNSASAWGSAAFMGLTLISVIKEDFLGKRILPHRERGLHGFLMMSPVVVFFVQCVMWPFLNGASIVVSWFLTFSTWGLRWSLGFLIFGLNACLALQVRALFGARRSLARSGSAESPKVREAVPEDASFIWQSQIRMARESEGVWLNEEIVRPGTEAVFRDPSLGRYFVAEMKGQLVGCLLVTREWSEWRNGHIF